MRSGDARSWVKTLLLKKGVIEDALGKNESDLAPAYRSVLGYLDSGKLPKGEARVELITRLAYLLAFLL